MSTDTDPDDHPPRAHVWRDDAGGWRFHLREANGRIIATSGESFTEKHHAMEMAERIVGPMGGVVVDDNAKEGA